MAGYIQKNNPTLMAAGVGKPAVTHFEVLAAAEHTMLRVSLETGRTHQIRIHLSAIGHPIVGDKLYGPSTELYLEFARAREMTEHLWQALGIDRQALHASALCFPHPSTRQMLTVESPWPPDLAAHVEELSRQTVPAPAIC